MIEINPKTILNTFLIQMLDIRSKWLFLWKIYLVDERSSKNFEGVHKKHWNNLIQQQKSFRYFPKSMEKQKFILRNILLEGKENNLIIVCLFVIPRDLTFSEVNIELLEIWYVFKLISQYLLMDLFNTQRNHADNIVFV